ncbi:AraC family transcriptional regulator [Robiginitalea sp. SC105]|uniref:helix-turn-helix domain-containing protein n=1 Tax=Robiginitalea sp. SC105 TaxID=2762332 RepID=UPI00163B21D1|nr:helix-turn-helix domain-containing protein [Robiginitalea sp. SC105]MBC2838892.1 helix-turn-helix domain-containing protein [Robiginitalea sp. SC105]
MDFTAVFNFFLIAGAFQGFVFNLGTFLVRRRIEAPVLFLNLFVFMLSMNNLQSWVIDKGFTPDGFFWDHLQIPWNVLIVPMFYAFLVHYLGLEKQRLLFWRLSFAIFAAELLARVGLVVAAGRGAVSEELLEHYTNLEDGIALAYSLFLYFKAWHLLKTYPSMQTQVLQPENLKWLHRFMTLGGLVILLWMFAVFLNSFSAIFNPPYTYYPLRISSTLLIYWVGYQAFFQYVLLQDRLALRKRLGDKPVVPGAVAVSSEDRSESGHGDFLELDSYIREHERYLDPVLSQDRLAEELGMGTSTMSRLVNRFSGYNFPDYINSYRVDYARELLGNPEFSPYTITAIGLECGFNSKSTFYTAFRKFTGQTPTAFRSAT